MKFHEYLESTYVSTNLQLHTNYHPYLQAKSRAVQKLIDAQRRVYMWASYVVLISQYLGVKVGLKKAPLPAMEIAKAVNSLKTPLQEDQKKLDLTNEPISDAGIPNA